MAIEARWPMTRAAAATAPKRDSTGAALRLRGWCAGQRGISSGSYAFKAHARCRGCHAAALRSATWLRGPANADADDTTEPLTVLAAVLPLFQGSPGRTIAEVLLGATKAQQEARVTAAELVTARDAKGWIPVMYADFHTDRITVLALLRHAPEKQLAALSSLMYTQSSRDRVVSVLSQLATVPLFFSLVNTFVRRHPSILDVGAPLHFLLFATIRALLQSETKSRRRRVRASAGKFASAKPTASAEQAQVVVARQIGPGGPRSEQVFLIGNKRAWFRRGVVRLRRRGYRWTVYS